MPRNDGRSRWFPAAPLAAAQTRKARQPNRLSDRTARDSLSVPSSRARRIGPGRSPARAAPPAAGSRGSRQPRVRLGRDLTQRPAAPERPGPADLGEVAVDVRPGQLLLPGHEEPLRGRVQLVGAEVRRLDQPAQAVALASGRPSVARAGGGSGRRRSGPGPEPPRSGWGPGRGRPAAPRPARPARGRARSPSAGARPTTSVGAAWTSCCAPAAGTRRAGVARSGAASAAPRHSATRASRSGRARGAYGPASGPMANPSSAPRPGSPPSPGMAASSRSSAATVQLGVAYAVADRIDRDHLHRLVGDGGSTGPSRTQPSGPNRIFAHAASVPSGTSSTASAGDGTGIGSRPRSRRPPG